MSAWILLIAGALLRWMEHQELSPRGRLILGLGALLLTQALDWQNPRVLLPDLNQSFALLALGQLLLAQARGGAAWGLWVCAAASGCAQSTDTSSAWLWWELGGLALISALMEDRESSINYIIYGISSILILMFFVLYEISDIPLTPALLVVAVLLRGLLGGLVSATHHNAPWSLAAGPLLALLGWQCFLTTPAPPLLLALLSLGLATLAVGLRSPLAALAALNGAAWLAAAASGAPPEALLFALNAWAPAAFGLALRPSPALAIPLLLSTLGLLPGLPLAWAWSATSWGDPTQLALLLTPPLLLLPAIATRNLVFLRSESGPHPRTRQLLAAACLAWILLGWVEVLRSLG